MRLLRILGLSFLINMSGYSLVYADMSTVAGDWQTIDHVTHQPSSIIRIWQSQGKYHGKVVKIYEENGHKVTDRCLRCKGSLHNQRILGMKIITNFSALSADKYVGGMILDPTSGKRYHCVMRLIDDNQRLKVHGYIGVPILGRTDVWVRVVGNKNSG